MKPTMGRLMAAIAFAVFGYVMFQTLTPYFPEGNPPGYFLSFCIILGIFCGWRICGKRLGYGYTSGITAGWTTAFAWSFIVVFWLGFSEMITRSMRLRYDGPVEAVVGSFELMFEWGASFAYQDVAVAIIVGGTVCGIFGEFFAKRFS